MKIIMVLDKIDLVGIQKFQRQLNLPGPTLNKNNDGLVRFQTGLLLCLL